jgi:integrase
MPNCNLDAIFVRNASSNGKAKETYYDNGITGFTLEVRSTGSMTYALRYRDPHGKLRQHTIGNAKDISFQQAKTTAEKLRSRVVLGDNPAEERKTKRTIPTFAEFASEKYMPFVKGYKKSWDSDDSYLRNHVLPKFAHCHLDEVTQQAVIELHHSMKATGYAPATANRMVILMRYMYNLAKKWKIPGGEVNPTHGVDMFEVNNARERFLTAEEAQRLVQTVKDSENTQLQYIIPLLLLLGCRKRELLEAQWNDFDLERRSWRIPMTKSGKPRHVPLSGKVLEILAAMPRWPGCPFVVPNPKTLKPYVSFFISWDTARKKAGMPEVRIHDLRHSAASFLINANHSLYVVQKLLGHTQIKTTARYSHLAPETMLNAVDTMADAAGMGVTAVAPVPPTTPTPVLRLIGKKEKKAA